MQRGLAGLLDFGQRILVFLDRDRVGVVGRLVHRLVDLFADIRRQSVPELRVHDHGVLQMRVIGHRNVLLNFVKFLRQIIGSGVLAGIDHPGLQRLVYFRERHDLRDRADVAEIAVGNLGAGDTDLEALEIGRRDQRTVGRGHVETVIPVREPADALGFQFLEQPLADRAFHRLGVGVYVLEQPWQIERLELLDAERREFRGRGRQHLHRAELQRLDLFLVLVKRGVRVNFDSHLAVGVFLGKFLEFQCAFSLRRVVGDDMAEFDDDRALGEGCA